MQNNHMYIAIDLKTFYASVECVERNLDPLDTNLVVADPQRTEKTICPLPYHPSIKGFSEYQEGLRLFEVVTEGQGGQCTKKEQVKKQAVYRKLI